MAEVLSDRIYFHYNFQNFRLKFVQMLFIDYFYKNRINLILSNSFGFIIRILPLELNRPAC